MCAYIYTDHSKWHGLKSNLFAEATPQHGGVHGGEDREAQHDEDLTIPATDSQLDEALGGTPSSMRESEPVASPRKSMNPKGSGSSPAPSTRSIASSSHAMGVEDPVHSQLLTFHFVFMFSGLCSTMFNYMVC